MAHHAGDQIAELGVEQKADGNQGDGQPHDAPRGFQHQQNGSAAENKVHLGGRPGIQHDHVVIPDDIAADRRTGSGQQHVVPGELMLAACGPRRIQQIDQHQHKAQVHGALDLRRVCAGGRCKKMESGKGDAEHADKNFQSAPERTIG